MIRRFHPWEIEDVSPIAEAFYGEAKLGGPFNREHFQAALNGMSAAGRLYLCGRFDESKLVGVLAGMITQNAMSGELIAQELFWYVLPAHRGGLDSVRMLRDFESWAQSQSARHIFMANFISQETGEQVGALYVRTGYSPVETHFIKTF